MTRIGNNEFFETAQGAKTAGTRRGYSDGASVVDTSEGYCLLDMGEGADAKSYNTVNRGQVVAVRRNGKWQEA